MFRLIIKSKKISHIVQRILKKKNEVALALYDFKTRVIKIATVIHELLITWTFITWGLKGNGRYGPAYGKACNKQKQKIFLNEWLNHYSQTVITNSYHNLEFKSFIGHLKLYAVCSQIVFPLVLQKEGATDFIHLTSFPVSLSTLFSLSEEAVSTKRKWGFQCSSWRGSSQDEEEIAESLG